LSVHKKKESIKNPVSNKSLSKIDEIGSWQNGVFTCSVCGKAFIEKLKLVEHVESVHEKKKPDMAEHVETVLNIEDFGEKSDKTKLLDDHFEDKEALNKQCLSVHEEKESIKNLVSNKSLSKIDQIGSWQNGVFKCSICGKEFIEKLKLVKHVESVHEKNKPDLVEHLESVPEISMTSLIIGSHLVRPLYITHKCYICKTKFVSENVLAKHFSIQHKGEKPYQCNLCDVKFKGKDKLKRHLSTIHGRKIFNCSVCQKSFSRKDNLKVHLESCLRKQSKKQVPKINEKKNTVWL
jgi:KRAB domain-containing zinc finger protein